MPLKLEHKFMNCKKIDLEKSGINRKPIQRNGKCLENSAIQSIKYVNLFKQQIKINHLKNFSSLLFFHNSQLT